MKLFTRWMNATPDPGIPMTNEPAQPGATPEPAAQTPQQAATVDVDAILEKAQAKAEEAAQKKMEGVFRSMLEQQGLDADTIAKMTDEWKSKQVTPESQLKELQDRLAAAQKDGEAKDKRFTAIEKGVPADKVDKYVKLAEAYADDKSDFAAALDAALADFPVQSSNPTIVKPATGDGVLGAEDEFERRINKYKRRE